MLPPLAVFDLDGTLVDTAPDLVATLNVILAREGLPPVAYDAARNMVGGGARLMIERGLATQVGPARLAHDHAKPGQARVSGDRKLATAEVDKLVKDFIEHYAAHIADRSQPFPGLEAALDDLEAAGCRLAVCTNKLEWLAVRLLDALGLAKRFVAICGGDTFGIQKPNPELLRRTIARCETRVEQAVMIGDSISDIAMAKAAGVPVIAVDYGYTDTPVADLGPDRVISAFSQLPGAVFDLFGNGMAASATPR
jgi:phosphoglycolate phosphatase